MSPTCARTPLGPELGVVPTFLVDTLEMDGGVSERGVR
jgi:hypothetical protein